jgi:hypothetical protein
MISFCQEVQKFITACEAIHALLLRGGSLTPDERDVVEFSAIDLLSKVRPA